MKHDLKVWKEFVHDLRKGKKRLELRKNDRDFKKGDILNLQEYDKDKCEYGRWSQEYEVLHIVENPLFGLQEGYVAMSIKKITINKMKQIYVPSDIVRDSKGYATIISKKGLKYQVYDCDSGGIPTKPANYREIEHKEIIEQIH